MLHYTPRAIFGTVLFRTWNEARLLWDVVTGQVPRLTALALMPDHVHLLAPADVQDDLSRALRAFAIARNRRRGERGAVWSHEAYASPVSNQDHARRVARYIYLNPVRAGLVDDPLAWPFSTLRDVLGLAVSPVRAAVPRPAALLEYVSRDADTRLSGSEMPMPPGDRRPSLDEVRRAVSAVGRFPAERFLRRGAARWLLVSACRALTGGSAAEIARFVGLSRTAVSRVPVRTSADVGRVLRVCGDPRFDLLEPGDLRKRWPRYADRR